MDAGAVSVIDISPFLDGSSRVVDPHPPCPPLPGQGEGGWGEWVEPSGGSGRDEIVAAVRQANTSIGFLVITGHGVPEASIQRVRHAALNFFALPRSEKCRYAPEQSWFFRGYEPIGGSALARSKGVETPPDLCELFRVSRFDDPEVARAAGAQPGLEYFFAPNIWPERPAELRPALLEYYAQLESLAASLMRIFALALDLPEMYFEPTIDHHITNLCLNYYPAQNTPPLPGQLRRGAHTDYGSLTILHQDDAPGGLQVRVDNRWEDVPHVPGSYVINIGDMLARWTNDRWVSTLHRVINPGGADVGRDRLSIPFFHQPNFDAVIACLPSCASADRPPRYEPVTSGEWVRRQTRRQVGVE